MKKFVFAAVCTLAMVGFVMADEFTANISKVDGNKVTFAKTTKDPNAAGKKGAGGKKGGGGGGQFKKGDPMTADAAASVKVFKGVFDKDAGALKEEAVAEGLKADAFKNIDDAKGLNATITVADDGADKGKITKIVLKGGGKKGGGN